MHPNNPIWTIAVFATRETASTLRDCIQSALYACGGGPPAIIDVLINGNKPLARNMAAGIHDTLAMTPGSSVNVWSIDLGDKAHAWNEYIDKIWQPSALSYFIDGYSEVRADAFGLLADGLGHHPEAIGATGVPTSGRTAPALRNRMLQHGGLHGNLFVVRGSVVALIRESGFRLPLGLYRTDGLIGAALMFRLDPAHNPWDTKCVFVHGEATWDVKSAPRWSAQNLLAQCKRRLRQAQGAVENRAVREHLAIKRSALAVLPRTVNGLVQDWVEQHRREAMRLFMGEPLALLAVRRLLKPRDWSTAQLLPQLLATATGHPPSCRGT